MAAALSTPTPSPEDITPADSPQTPEPRKLVDDRSIEIRLATFYLSVYFDKSLDTLFVSVYRTPENKITAPIGDWISIVDRANANIALGNYAFEFKVGEIQVRSIPDYLKPVTRSSLLFRQIVPDGQDMQMELTKVDYRYFRCRLPILVKLEAIILQSDTYDYGRDPILFELSKVRKGVIFFKADLQFEIFTPPFCGPTLNTHQRLHKEPYIEIRDGDFKLNFNHTRLDTRMCKKLSFLSHLEAAYINLVDPLDNLLQVAIFRSQFRGDPGDEEFLQLAELQPKDYITFNEDTWTFLEKCIEFFLAFNCCETNIDDVTNNA